MRRSSELLLALLLGAGTVAAFAPLAWFPLAWVGLGGFFLLLRRANGSRAAGLTGFAFGFGMFLTGVSWIYVSLHDFGGMPAALAVLATVLFCAFLALYPALVGAVFLRLPKPALIDEALVFAALWGFGEWLRGWLLTGFPWLAIGYSQSPPSPLAGYAPVLGVYGVSFVTALVAVGLAAWASRFFGVLPRSGEAVCRDACSAWPLLAAGVLLAGGDLLREVRWTHAVGEPVRVALLQGNVAQELKWRPERFVDSLLAYYRLAREHPAQLTILPETALPAFFDNLPPEFLRDLEALARANHGDLLLGSVVGNPSRYTNSVVSLGQSPRQSYSKTHLVPFGEMVPPGFGWVLAVLRIPMSEFTRGEANQLPLAVAGQQVAINICYEDVFGEEVIRALPRATILVNVSNTAWFGRSWAQPQHLQIARMRALESGRPMLRATNTGMTAVVQPDGTVSAGLDSFTRGALVAEVSGYQGMTPFARFGNAPVLVLMAALLAGSRIAAGRRGVMRTP